MISQRCGADIAFFLQDLDGGGAERAIVTLAGEIAKQGCTADFVVGDGASDYRSEVSSEVHVHDFATRSPLLVFCRLVAYLRRRSPAVVMSIMLISAAFHDVLLHYSFWAVCGLGLACINQLRANLKNEITKRINWSAP